MKKFIRVNFERGLFFAFFFITAAIIQPQESEQETVQEPVQQPVQQWAATNRGSIPEDLIRPNRAEAPRYPVDTVIGELGKGEASDAAFSFARTLAEGFISGDLSHSGLVSVNADLREDYLSVLEMIEPGSYRLGGGREEADGSFSFLVRFIGREQGITSELFVRYVTKRTEEIIDDEVIVRTTGEWLFDDLILEEAKSREEEHKESLQRFDFSPYERFF